MSVLEGSLGFIRRRIMVLDEDSARARRTLEEAGLGSELSRPGRLLGGRLSLVQHASGHRAGTDAVLLAPARVAANPWGGSISARGRERRV